jgi:hypothetical protein
MTIDLTSAGQRGLETLDSITDMQQSLNLVKYYFDKLNVALSDLSKHSEGVRGFIKNNPTIEAEIINPPTSNSPLAERSKLDFPFTHSVGKTMNSPELSQVRLADARVFRSAFDNESQFAVTLISMMGVRKSVIKNFI